MVGTVISVADPGCLSRIRMFFHPGCNKKKEQGKNKLVILPVLVENY
jgi:hypothetical protein